MIDNTPQPMRAVVLHVDLPSKDGESKSLREPEDKLLEAINLADALNLEIVHSSFILLKRINPKTLIGEGRLEELRPIIENEDVNVVIVNSPLSPSQQRNLEVSLQTKVIDRTHLILEIFADRARTKAGRLQVQLAQQQYAQGRLVRAWTHLERQRGGMGKTGGPGERQIELDRRMIRESIASIKKQLESVEKERDLQRKGRKKSGIPVVSLVGYTNAGKSTLFNKIVEFCGSDKSEAHVQNMLFATLDPLMRKIKLPSGREVILSDTVGFVSDLPHELVEAFKSTLEEVTLSQLLLHVEDASSTDRKAQEEDVKSVLKSIGAQDHPVIVVGNKYDLCSDEEKLTLSGIGASAVTGYGVGALLDKIDDILGEDEQIYDLTIPAWDGKKLAWIHENAKIIEQNLVEDTWHIKIRVKKEFVHMLWK